MNEIDKKATEAETEPLVSLVDIKQEPQTEDNEKTEIENNLIVDESDAGTDSESVGITPSNGKNDPSIPMLEKIKEVLKNYSK